MNPLRASAAVAAIAAMGLLSALAPQACAAPAEIRVEEDAVYGRVHGAGLLADIAYPAPGAEAGTLSPAILSVHGGRWRAGHKRDKSAIVVRQWAELGFFAMSIDYRLVECTPVPACYQDLQCAIRFFHANADKYRIDPERIFLIGQSAGGHLVSLAAAIGDGPWPRTGGWEEADNGFAGVISVAACYELPSLSWGNIWAPPGRELVEAQREASPVYHVRASMVPLLIIHSDDDRSVPIANALLMVEALEKAGAKHRFHHYTDHGHMGITEEVIARSLEFIDEVSKGRNN